MAVQVVSAGNVLATPIVLIRRRGSVPKGYVGHVSASAISAAMEIHRFVSRGLTAISVAIVMAIGIVRIQTSPCVP
tara:strand:+ start:187 stop:414 length:228 start_codon:yes stop_codon:yes gene_type:complete